ncbi:MAG: ferritin-like domain-containing protein [Bacillota bacterium]
MGKQFNSLEILKMAISVEEDGEKFYEKCAAADSKAEEVKRIFSNLAEDEREHRAYFKELLNEFDAADTSISQDYLYEELASDYLRVLIDDQIFPSDEEEVDKIASNLGEAIDVGIRVEKNSILLYQEIIQDEDNPATADALKKIIAEEKSHLISLRKLKSYL